MTLVLFCFIFKILIFFYSVLLFYKWNSTRTKDFVRFENNFLQLAISNEQCISIELFCSLMIIISIAHDCILVQCVLKTSESSLRSKSDHILRTNNVQYMKNLNLSKGSLSSIKICVCTQVWIYLKILARLDIKGFFFNVCLHKCLDIGLFIQIIYRFTMSSQVFQIFPRDFELDRILASGSSILWPNSNVTVDT